MWLLIMPGFYAALQFSHAAFLTGFTGVLACLKYIEEIMRAIHIYPVAKHIGFAVRDIFPGGQIGIDAQLTHCATSFPETYRFSTIIAEAKRFAAIFHKFIKVAG